MKAEIGRALKTQEMRVEGWLGKDSYSVGSGRSVWVLQRGSLQSIPRKREEGVGLKLVLSEKAEEAVQGRNSEG